MFFFLAIVILYHLIARFAKNAVLIQNVFLLAASLFFYAFADLRFVPFLLYIIAVSWLGGRFCKNKASLAAFIVADLAPLLTLKYCPQLLHTRWIFPLGISFFTFQSVSYIADSYTKKIPSEKSLLHVALFISFFPVVSSGPIQRAGTLIPQFRNVRRFDYDSATDGMKLFAWGVFKKLCIADKIAFYVDSVYGNVSEQYGIALLMVAVLYSFQIYCDFSGYSDMAIGIARYLGFDVGKNFDHPYLSQSVGEFWRRWHISLSSWLRDYVYIPLGGSRVALPRIYLNLIATFFVSGIWHGSTLNFVIWGLIHGCILCVERATRPVMEKARIPAWIKVFVTFCLVTFAWIFFRAQNLAQASAVIAKIASVPKELLSFSEVLSENGGFFRAVKTLLGLPSSTGYHGLFLIFVCLAVFLVASLSTAKQDGLQKMKAMPVGLRWTLYVLLCFCTILLASKSSSVFIYNQF